MLSKLMRGQPCKQVLLVAICLAHSGAINDFLNETLIMGVFAEDHCCLRGENGTTSP